MIGALPKSGSRVGIRPAFAAVLALAGLVRGSTAIQDQNVWLNLSVTGPLLGARTGPNPWRFYFDSPNRFADDAHRYAQGAWRSAVGCHLSPRWSAWAGYGHTRTATPYARVPFGEHRPFQQLLWSRRAGRTNLGYRLRLEERFPDTGTDLGLRLRQQFRLSHPAPGLKPLAWVLSEEYFLNLNVTDYGARRGIDQNRIFAGVAWQWSEGFRSELGYLHHFTNRHGQPNRLNHVLALNLALSLP